MRIGILGPLEIVADGRPAEAGGARLRALLTLLALEAGRTVPADRIIDDLWEDRAPAGAPNALQSLVSRLRAVIGRERVESRPGAYRLVLPRTAVDAHDFEARLLAARGTPDPAARADGLRGALALWRGPALADAAGLPFAEGPAARLEGLRRAALEERIDADLALGRYAALIPELQALAAAEPLREPVRTRLIKALYGAGRQAEALAEYGSAKRALAEELGVDPSPDLESVHLAVLRQDPALLPPRSAGAPAAVPEESRPASVPEPPPRPAAGNLRARLTSFIGRDDDLRRVGKMLAEERLVTLTGPGGAGKTRLSLEAAERHLAAADGLAANGSAPADGVWFVELAPLTDPAEVPPAVLAALGLRETMLLPAGLHGMTVGDAGDPLDRVAAALAGKRLLLVLDNCEHLLDAAARLADRVLAGCPGVRVLATSREPLGITGETLWPVEPLRPPPAGAGVAEAAANPAVRLLADRAAAVSPGFAVTPANVESLVRICRALDGMPLAIELAAVRLRALTPHQVADRLGDRFRLLATGSRTALPRHQTLRAMVEWSWDLLDEAGRALWRRLSVFTGGATLASAERVCAGPGLDPDGVLEALAALADKSLLVVEGDGADGSGPRYRMLETIRAYGAERLAEAGEEERVRRAHAEYLAELAETAEPRLYRHDQLRWMAVLRAEHDNLHTALRWAISAGDGVLAVRICAALGWYWFLRGVVQEAKEFFAEVMAMPGLPEDETTATALAHGVMFTFEGPWENVEAKAWLRRVMRITEGLGGRRPHPVLRVMVTLMRLFAQGWDERSRAAARPMIEDPDPWVRAIGHFVMGQLALNFGRVDEAAGDLDAALRGFKEAGDRWGLSFTLTAQGDVLSWRGEHRAAAGLFAAALRHNAPLGGGAGMFVHMHSRLANELDLLGEHGRARDILDEALRDAERIGSPEAMAFLHMQYGEFASRAGDAGEAVRRLELAEEFARRANPPHLRAMVLVARAHLDLDEGGTEAARRRLDEALPDAVRALDHPIVADVLVGLAHLAAREGDAERAAWLLGTADGLRGVRDLSRPLPARIEAMVRDALGAAAFEAPYRRGAARTLDDVIAAFGMERPPPPLLLARPDEEAEEARAAEEEGAAERDERHPSTR
ncbi:BTAD domain-containing putative transcriptional regulator [Actinomadura sp. 21ATH]|uniref:BTAD domain-containing putative transcriptional regulator n=1 Tax=Actinomadura sp. 21ATH TaxID=1735444 RepID=UPI0035C0E587